MRTKNVMEYLENSVFRFPNKTAVVDESGACTYQELLAACRNYVEKTGRRVIFEYALVGGVNCEERHARELASRLRGLQCHVNLIPLNEVKERSLRTVDEGTVRRFLKTLEECHISATRRREMGDDIDGACGQLRRKTLAESAAHPAQ